MLISWLIYIVLLIGAVAFAVLYKDMLALVLLALVVIMPIIMLLCLVITRLLTRVSVEIKDGVVHYGETAKMKIKVKNHSPFSAASITIKVVCKNEFLGSSSLVGATVFAKPFSTENFEFAVTGKHIGRMEIYAKRAVMRDFFRMFAFTQKLDVAADVTFIPPVLPIEVNARHNSFLLGESDIFSKTKPGDDPSEVFDIRDYRGGDKLNRIHWKLTAKQGEMMVKDYSFPINESLLLFADLSVDEDRRELDKIDAMFTALISSAFNLVEQKKVFMIGWYDCTSDRFFSEKIKDLDDVYVTLGRIFSSRIGSNFPEMLSSSIVTHNFLSHICVFTAKPAEIVVHSVQAAGATRVLHSAVVAVNDNDNTNYASDEVNIRYIHDGSVAEDLLDFVI